MGWATQRRQVIKRNSSGATRAKADWRRLKKNGRKEVASRVNSFEDVSWLTRGRGQVGWEGELQVEYEFQGDITAGVDARKGPREEESLIMAERKGTITEQ